MNEPSPPFSDETAEQLLRSLLHKQGNWVDWGKACQHLQKAGYDSQTIFEQTGFQASQQNQIIVASQVYESLVTEGASEAVLSYFLGPKSDILYEFRLLNQEQRMAAAELAHHKNLDVDEAKNLTTAIKDYARLSQPPAEFTAHPGDMVAYQCWKRARQIKDLQVRSRLIAQGLKFAHSPSAREAVEKLLSDFTVISSRNAPLLPIYRQEAEEQLSRIVPVVGKFPLSATALSSSPSLSAVDPFGMVDISDKLTVVALPGWQVIFASQDPVAIVATSDQLLQFPSNTTETVLLVVDRRVTQWNAHSYFLVEQDGQLSLQWFEEAPPIPLLAQLLLVMRPKKILDENNLLEPWQMDD